MMSRGAFDGELSTEQLVTKKQIESIIEEGSVKPRIVSQKTLEKYEAIFQTSDLKDETEMEEEDPEENDSNILSSYEFEKQKTSEMQESMEKRDHNGLNEAKDQRKELPVHPILTSTKLKNYENVADLKESNNQNVTKMSAWKDYLKKCYFNDSSSYLDVFYKCDSHIQNKMLRFSAELSRNLTFKKLKKKKSRKRINSRTQEVCTIKTACCLRHWLSFELKMCIPRFNWLAVNVTRNGVQHEEYLPFPNKRDFKKQILEEDSVRQSDIIESNVGQAKDSVSDELRNKDEKQEARGVKTSKFEKDLSQIQSEDKKENETKSSQDYNKDPVSSKDEIRIDLESEKWLSSTERAVEKLLNLRKANSEKDLSVDKVTKIIDEKSKEQLLKIQTLELSISKLENRLLREQLSKTNDSSSISRLENHILRLENELIKINQTYMELRHENEQLKKSQRRYLELSHGSGQNQSKVSTGAYSENYTLIIGQHKMKLTELTYQLRNQSELVAKYKKQLEQVEDQNRMLYQIVMNQSLLISQVMKKIQILSNQIQENHQKKHDYGMITPTELIKHLENMVAGNRKARRRPKRVSSPQKHNSRQCLKYHLYKMYMSKACLKFDVAEKHKVQILSKNHGQMKGGLPKTATIKISDPVKTKSENLLNKEKEERDKEKDKQVNEMQTKKTVRPQSKTEEMETKVRISLQKQQELKVETGKSQTDKSRQPDNLTQGENPPVSNKVEKAAAAAEKNTEKIASKKPLYEDPENKDPKDCYELYQKGNSRNGAYKIRPAGFQKFIEVFCDMKCGGWTVIQRRQGGTTNFFRDWNMYKKGFGGVYGEHWIGNDIIHQLTNQKAYKLRIDLTDWNKNKVTAFYDYFMVEHENEGYRLHVEGFTGEGGDSLSKHNLHKFSTRDVDNDRVTKQFGGSCANRFSGAWWYHKCYSSNLNGVFYRNGVVAEKKFDGIAWKSWKGPNYSMMKTEMKIAPTTIEMK